MQGGAVFFTADALSKLSHWKRESTASTFLRCSWFRRVLSFPSITNFSWLERERLHASGTQTECCTVVLMLFSGLFFNNF